MGLILITHDLAILGESCDKIAVMYAGKIVEMGTVEDIFGKTAHPYTKGLISCFPHTEKEKIIPKGIEGVPPNMLTPPKGCYFHPRCYMAIDICKKEEPESINIGGKHTVSCHRYIDAMKQTAREVLNGQESL